MLESCVAHRDFLLRRTCHADAKEIAAIHKAAVNSLRGGVYHEEEIAAWLAAFVPREVTEAIEDSSCIFQIAEYQGNVVGFGLVKANELIALYVLPQYQRHSIGSRLLQNLEKLSKRANIRFLQCRISLCAREFYAKNGYAILEKQIHLGIRHYNSQKWFEGEVCI